MKKVLEKQLNGLRMKNKLYIAGDSFCEARNYPYPGPQSGDFYFWVEDLSDYLKDTHDLILDSKGSRDAQTIIDNWIKIIPHLKSDDILIVCMPCFFRVRLPLEESSYKTVKWDEGQLTNRFTTHHSWYKTSTNVIYLNKQPVTKKELDKTARFLEEMYLDNTSIEKNYNEVIESLYNLTPCKKYIFSWDNMKNKTSVIKYRNDITAKLGWSTRDDLWKETNGEAGWEGDIHWDYKFEKIFADYLKNKFKQK